MKRTWTCLLAILMLLSACLLAGCGDGTAPETPTDTATGTGTGTGTDGGTDTGEPSAAQQILLEHLDELKIVYPSDAPESVVAAAKSLRSVIEATYGKKVDATIDFIRDGSNVYRELPYEILLGDTAREESGAVLNDLLAGDWGWALSGKKIVIKAGDSDTLVRAIGNFGYDIVMMKKGGKTTLYSSAWDTVSRYDYAARTMQWNGVDATQYAIVYPAQGTGFERQLAERLADQLALMSGNDAWSVVPDSTAGADSYALAVGQTSLSGSKVISLGGETPRALALAENAFLAMIEAASQNGNAALTITEPIVGAEVDSFTTMSYNVFGFDVTSPRTERVCKLILRHLPDLILFQEPADNWMQVLNAEFSEYYGVVLGKPRHDGQQVELPGADTYLPIYYAKDRYEVVESGTRWLTATPDEVSALPGAQYYRTITWAKLRDLHTGEVFVVVNNHLDTASDAIRLQEMLMTLSFLAEKYPNDPILLGGDMNSLSSSAAMQLVKECGFISANSTYGGIDWIFCTADSVSVSNWRECAEKIDDVYPSDHHPILSTFTVKAPEEPIVRGWEALLNYGLAIKADPETGFGRIDYLY